MRRRAQPWLGTLVEITLPGPHGGADAEANAEADRAIDLAFASVARVHKLMSFHDADSDVSRLNRAAPGTLLAVHPDTWQVLALAEEVAAASDGVFDIGCAPALVAWQLLPAPEGAAPPRQTGSPALRCEPDGQVRKLAAGWIDLGGIAKGYAVDLAIEALLRAGVASACVNAGGDLRAVGPHAFPVLLRAAHDPRRLHAPLFLRDGALATSAGYFSRKAWNDGKDGKDGTGATVCALIDGRDGKPLATTRSVTVRAPRCVLADALTKVVLATGDAGHAALARFGASAVLSG